MTEIEEIKYELEKRIDDIRNYRERIEELQNTIDSLKANLSRKDHDLNRLKGKLEGYEFCIKQFAERK